MDKTTSGVIPQFEHGLVLQLHMVTMNRLCKSATDFFTPSCYAVFLDSK